jgi:hypothetical protein
VAWWRIYALSLLLPTQALSPTTGHVCLVDAAQLWVRLSEYMIETDPLVLFFQSLYLIPGSIHERPLLIPSTISGAFTRRLIGTCTLHLTTLQEVIHFRCQLAVPHAAFVLVQYMPGFDTTGDYSRMLSSRPMMKTDFDTTWIDMFFNQREGAGSQPQYHLIIDALDVIPPNRTRIPSTHWTATHLPDRPGAVKINKTPVNKTRTVREPSIPARLDGRRISAFPDIGAPANFIALNYVRDRGLPIDFAARKSIKTSVGSTINILGTVTLPFSFKGEATSHQLTFNVIHKSVHEVILGSPFLTLTQTFTRYVHRLRQMVRAIPLPRVCYLGSHQYVSGKVNDTYVDAVPDTGADVSVMSLSFAEEHGFSINTSPEHQVLLEFADSSTATSIGVVEIEWKFGSSEVSHRINTYILEELQRDLILDNTFLHDADAFIVHEEDFWIDDSDSFEDDWMISIIKLSDSVLKHSRWKKSCKSFKQARSICANLADICT